MLTELQAVNRLLRLAGLHEVDSLAAADLTREAAQSQSHLAEENRRIQQSGWWFNSEDEVELTPDGQDEIVLPSGTLKVHSSRPQFLFFKDEALAYRVDGGTPKLWNPEKGSFKWDDSLFVRIVVEVPFVDSPPTFQEYALTSAQILLLRHVSASDRVIAEARRDLGRAFNEFHEEELQQQRSRGNNLQVAPGVVDLLTKR